MTAVRIEVTAEDIALGERDEGLSCPIALAMHRIVPVLPGAFIGAQDVYPHGYAEEAEPSLLLPLPREATEFIAAFDDFCPDMRQYGDCEGDEEGQCGYSHVLPEPIAFDLEIPADLAVAARHAPPGPDALSAGLADLGADLSLILLHDDPDGGDQ